MNSSWLLLAIALAAGSSASSQNGAQRDAGRASAQVRRPDLTAALASWRAGHGAGWQLSIDRGTGYLEMLHGGSSAPASEPRDDAAWFTLARGELAATEAMHGLDARTLIEDRALFLPLGQVGCGDKTAVRFRQQVGGVPVEDGFANVLFDKRGALLSIQVTGQPRIAGFDVRPALTAGTASEYALAQFEAAFSAAPTSSATPQLVVAQVETEEQRVPVLAWRVTLLSEPASGAAVGRTYWIDARSGRVAKWRNAIENFDVSGTVYTRATADNYPDEPGHPTAQQPMKYARLTSAAGTVTTDANGRFAYPGVSGPLAITCTYAGTFNQIDNGAGADYSLVFDAATGNNDIVLNSTPTALVTAQANVFQAVNAQRDYIRSINPLDATGDYVHAANVNVATMCNAYYSGVAINFYRAAGACANTSYSSVVYHENGHWLNDHYGTANGGDGMGEGNADMWAMYLDDDPICSHDICGAGCNGRSGLNTRLFCGDAAPSCYADPHDDGEVWMGAGWKVRRNLELAFGVAAGGAIADNLFLAWMNAFNQKQIKSIIETQWLTLDDDDGSIDNGTPHYAQIDAAFREQGFPGFALAQISIAGVTQLADTQDQTGPYAVQASIVALSNPPVTLPVLHYQIGASAFVDVAMSNAGGDVFSASIPGQPAPASVRYYVTAGDSAGHAAAFPSNAFASNSHFCVGSQSIAFSDDFESDLGWTVSNTALTTGAWERGDPRGTAAQPEDDDPLGAGNLCYFTQQGPVGGAYGDNDVDGGPTVLTSPAFDLTGKLATIRYAYWQYNDDGDDSLLVQVSNGGAWVTARVYAGGGGGWQYDSFDVGGYVAPNSTVRVRFSIADTPNNSFTESAVDGVVVSTVGPVLCAQASTYCTAKINSLGCAALVSASGAPSVSSSSPFAITASQLINHKSAQLFYGFGSWSAPFHGGTLCVLTPLKRTPVFDTGGNVGPEDCSGVASFDFNARIHSGLDPQLVAGAVVDAQFYYRDPADAQSVGLSNAIQFQICP